LKINIVIPTLHRPQKLLQCINSINLASLLIEEHRWFLYIYYSDVKDLENDDELYSQQRNIFVRLLDKPYNASEFWDDYLKEQHFDIFIYLNDDVIVESLFFKKIVDIMNKQYPNLDGVIGFRQANIPLEQTVKTAYGAIGEEFVERFPNRAVFMPAYRRFFLDKELELYAIKINKLYFDEIKSPQLIHLHPAFDKSQLDETHLDVRKYLREDNILFNRRKAKNLIWGENFEI